MLRNPPSGSHPKPLDAPWRRFAKVRQAARLLPDLEEGTAYGTPAFRLKGKFLLRLREDGESLVLRMDLDSRELLLRAKPEVFYITEHYRDYPAVLIRLASVTVPQLRGLLADAWEYVARKSLKSQASKPRPGPSASPKRPKAKDRKGSRKPLR